MLILAFLGFTKFSRPLPLNDKLLHFICLGIATGVFYFIFDVEEEARRIWFWRHAGLIFTAFVCFFCGGILSEFIQSMLPYKEFQTGDVVANLSGSSVGLVVAYYLEQYYRHRREIARLYRPLDTDPYSDDEDDPFAGTALLPTHRTSLPHQNSKAVNNANKYKTPRLDDVWDEREELFGIGEDDDDDEDHHSSTPIAGPPPPQTPIPKILITDSGD